MRHVVLASLVVASGVGCAGVAPKKPTASRAALLRADRTGPNASGVWDWMYRSTDDQGDMRVEQEEWHLAQRGGRIEGYYDRAVTLMSTDERLFRCNQRLGFTKATRVRIAGKIEGDRVVLHEVSFEAKPGPCDDGARNLVAYIGLLQGGTLALRWGPEAGQTLVRRSDPGHAPLDPEMAGVRQASVGESGPPVDGTWVWELRSIDAEGDERLEREEWHLRETADGLAGYYDRTVARARGDGVFECNHQQRFETITRYSITGQRLGDRLTLTETEYKAARSPCDNALRRLDTYQGHVADPDSLILSWGPGNQLLRRKR